MATPEQSPTLSEPLSNSARNIRVGIGGWVFPPWRGVLYPLDLPQARELAYASRRVTTIEINGTFYQPHLLWQAEARQLSPLVRRPPMISCFQ